MALAPTTTTHPSIAIYCHWLVSLCKARWAANHDPRICLIWSHLGFGGDLKNLFECLDVSAHKDSPHEV